ncbi:MAG TPA: hypothetical protein VEG37_05110 [Burkholderiales bacterium]|nr:hypothetical protein [Burkholderiales bacterium]
MPQETGAAFIPNVFLVRLNPVSRYIAYPYYEKFRPETPAVKKSWGAAGVLDLDQVRSMAR